MNCKDIFSIVRRHANEVACLTSEGYLEIWSTISMFGTLKTSMHHSVNGNKIIVETNERETAIWKNGTLKKVISYEKNDA